jgi:hypothetical protein
LDQASFAAQLQALAKPKLFHRHRKRAILPLERPLTALVAPNVGMEAECLRVIALIKYPGVIPKDSASGASSGFFLRLFTHFDSL